MIIRQMTHGDIEFACQCTVSEGWQGETRGVFEVFLRHDVKGCFVGEHGSKPVGICIATRYSENGVIGELVVNRAMRGRGFGTRLFEHSIAYLRSCGIENIYLDADLEAVPLYEKMGFRRMCRSRRFVGKIEGRTHGEVRHAGPQDVESICAIDRRLFGDDRGFFLTHRLSNFPRLNFVLEIEGHTTAYLMAQPGIGVVSVGPWAVTGTDDRPGFLLERLSLETRGTPLRIGVLETNTKAIRLMRSFGSLDERTPCWRMVLGSSERLGASSGLYAIGSAAKG